MWGKQRKTPVEKEWELLLKKEAKLYKSKQEKKDSKINYYLYFFILGFLNLEHCRYMLS